MTPAQVHMRVWVLSRIGILPSTMVGTPATHGAGVAGTQGIGVSTPAAAVVAAATVGLVGAEHIPNGMMFTIGM